MKNYFIDSHCHLHLPWFNDDAIKEALIVAEANQVNRVISCASEPRNYDQVIDSSNHQNLYITIGLQPTLADTIISSDPIRKILENHWENVRNDKGVIAIGEVGLDYYWVKDTKLKENQAILFKDCINLATEHNLPLVIHSRKAEEDCLAILEKYASTPVLLHSFEGNLELINKAIDLGYKISIPTNIVIRKNRRKVAKRAGLDNIMLETDAPFCSPSSDIKPNTPSTIPLAAKKLGTLFECSVKEIANTTTKNAIRIYKLE